MNLTSRLAPRLAAILSLAAALALCVTTGPSPSLAATAPSHGSVEPVPLPPLADGRPAGSAGTAAVDYHYAAAETQILDSPYPSGVSATFTVEHPKQVPEGHSLAEVAVESPARDYSYVEAGWIVMNNKAPKLFIFWWDQGVAKCYDQGCGYVKDGSGIQPGKKLKVGTSVTLTWQHRDGDWWLLVNGEPSGYYPDNQWTGSFTGVGFAQVFGEVAITQGQPVCDDMGNGKKAAKHSAASVTDVTFEDGPAVVLDKDVDDPADHYTMQLTGADSMRYGGPGLC